MKLKYSGTIGDTGLTLTATILDKDGQVVADNIPMTEVNETSLFISENLFLQGQPLESGLSKGTYLIRIIGEQGEQRGASELKWTGVGEAKEEMLSWSKREMMQIRDALGINGDKSVAKGGQLQKKSEYPYNTIIDTNEINNEQF